MRRREFITLLGGSAAWPLAARAQQSNRIRRIGVLHTIAQTDASAQPRVKAFEQAVQTFGWVVGGNLQIEYRWAAGDPDRLRAFAREIIDWKPDVIVGVTTATMLELVRHTDTVPIVFVQVPDPIVLGLVKNLSQPGTHITGFTNFEFAMGGKWLQILRDVAPRLTSVALLHNPQTDPQSRYYMEAMEAAVPGFAIDLARTPVHSPADIERSITELARDERSGLVVLANTFTAVHRKQIIGLANRLSVPAIYPFRYYAIDGGLVSYGIDTADLYRRAGAYVDRILRGANPATLPVQQPTKFELVINLKTAKALGLEVPPTLLATADEVIE